MYLHNDLELFKDVIRATSVDWVSEGISDMHCRSDLYLVEDLEREYAAKKAG